LNTAVLLAVFYIFKRYHRAWAYASLGELTAIVQAVTLGIAGTIALSYFARLSQPRSVVVMQWAFTILLVGGSRLAWRVLVEKKKMNVKRRDYLALIIGAGDAGAMVAREARGDKANYLPVGFVDDDPAKQNLSVLGLPVLGTRQDIPKLVSRYRVDLIIIAMPTVDGSIIGK
jgi:FlaA1/EpsC-like NDP-sugar epimerase